MKSNLKYSLLLMLAAIIWGAAFVSQSVGMDYLGPFSFNCIRNFLGAAALVPVATFFERNKAKEERTAWNDKQLIIGGIVCGFFLFLASSSQQIGIITTTAGKSGFITALYIILVPVFSLALKKRPGKFIWVSVMLALVGLYFLCINGSFSIQSGDFWLFACAILFSLQILAVDKFAPGLDCIKLSCYQFLVCAVLSVVPMITEHPTMESVVACWLPIAYAGLCSSGIAYTLQMIGQKHVEATLASLLMSLESVFSVVFGFILLHEKLSYRELIGCVLMFGAVILAQIAPSNTEATAK